jgi:shikimate dehydrogenase
MIDGQTELVGLIGWPVGHSLSPVMHNAAFDALGLNWRYVPLPVPPGSLEAAVRGLVALGFRGANVTVPHKQAVMPLLDVVSDTAVELGAVNTLVIKRRDDGSSVISGDNTDHSGFDRALRNAGFEPQAGLRAVVVGAGGGARAVVYSLLRSGLSEITVLNRRRERAWSLVADLGRLRRGVRLSALELTPGSLLASADSADLLVNTTPVGMWPQVDASICPDRASMPPHLTVFDLVYNPPETRLLQQARQSGARAIGGLGMLVQQGVLGFTMWTGEAAPIEAMRAACEQGLGRS